MSSGLLSPQEDCVFNPVSLSLCLFYICYPCVQNTSQIHLRSSLQNAPLLLNINTDVCVVSGQTLHVITWTVKGKNALVQKKTDPHKDSNIQHTRISPNKDVTAGPPASFLCMFVTRAVTERPLCELSYHYAPMTTQTFSVNLSFTPKNAHEIQRGSPASMLPATHAKKAQ